MNIWVASCARASFVVDPILPAIDPDPSIAIATRVNAAASGPVAAFSSLAPSSFADPKQLSGSLRVYGATSARVATMSDPLAPPARSCFSAGENAAVPTPADDVPVAFESEDGDDPQPATRKCRAQADRLRGIMTLGDFIAGPSLRTGPTLGCSRGSSIPGLAAGQGRGERGQSASTSVCSACSRSISWRGGAPNRRRYSRLNCDGLS